MPVTKLKMRTFTFCACLLSCMAVSAQEQSASADNGTDPTKFTTIAEGKYEYLDLNGSFSSANLRLSYTQPFGAGRWNIRARLPVAAVDVLGDSSYDIGDFSIELGHVFGLNRKGAFVAKGEMLFDTADRPELGTGQNVFKGTLIYAKFLKDGSIFAPAIVQSNSLGGDNSRADVNFTTFDFYYVPKLSNPKNLITYDPALNFDWENNKEFASLAITFGRVLGPQLGGTGILFLKPSIFAGGNRPGDWGIEVGYKVLAF
ncbi:MAG: hypothetical protein ACI9CB_002485 [Rhodothermales bacterium]|jgi:hypothetical protein